MEHGALMLVSTTMTYILFVVLPMQVKVVKQETAEEEAARLEAFARELESKQQQQREAAAAAAAEQQAEAASNT